MDLSTVAVNRREGETIIHGLLFPIGQVCPHGANSLLTACMLDECPVSEETQDRK